MNKQSYTLYWSPEGRPIATVQAATAQSAIRRAPRPYAKYKGELYVELTATIKATHAADFGKCYCRVCCNCL